MAFYQDKACRLVLTLRIIFHFCRNSQKYFVILQTVPLPFHSCDEGGVAAVPMEHGLHDGAAGDTRRTGTILGRGSDTSLSESCQCSDHLCRPVCGSTTAKQETAQTVLPKTKKQIPVCPLPHPTHYLVASGYAAPYSADPNDGSIAGDGSRMCRDEYLL